jgi:hypothetical protein
MPGASEQVAGIISFAKSEANQKAALAAAAYNQAISIIGVRPNLELIELQPPERLDGLEEAEDDFNEEYQTLMESLRAGFSAFFATYFPLDPTSLSAASAWLANALTNGGSGINVNVETQLWNRDRSRVLEDSGRAEDEAISGWAARRFPLPPGAATYQVLQIRKDAQAKIAEVSRTAAIKSFETEIENIRFAIPQAIQYQIAAVNAAAEYMKTLALPAQISAQVLTAKSQARAALATAAVAYYEAQLKMEDLIVKVGIVNTDAQNKINELNAKFEIEHIERRVESTIAAAASYGTQAAAALNALNAQASISGNDSTITNL